jgi:hypothetical protein
LIPDEKAEIALARSAAPASISDAAEVMALRRDGYAAAAKGSNGFVCIVSFRLACVCGTSRDVGTLFWGNLPAASTATGGRPRLCGCQKVQSVPALLALTFLVHIYIRRQIDDLYQFGSSELTGPARRNILRIAGDPQLGQSVAQSQRHQQSERPPGEMVASIFWSNTIGHMTSVQAHVLGVTDAEVDFSGPVPIVRTHYMEDVRRNPVFHRIRGLSRDQS